MAEEVSIFEKVDNELVGEAKKLKQRDPKRFEKLKRMLERMKIPKEIRWLVEELEEQWENEKKMTDEELYRFQSRVAQINNMITEFKKPKSDKLTLADICDKCGELKINAI